MEPREWVLFGPLSTAHRFGPRVGEGEEVRVVEAGPVERERAELLDALQEALAYVPEYFVEKWELDALLRRHGRLSKGEQ